MAIITNKDIKTMIEVEEFLHKKLVETNANDEEINLWTKYRNLVEELIKNKKDCNIKANKWNKENKEYHRIMNNICSNRKKGNEEKLKYWENEMKKIKE